MAKRTKGKCKYCGKEYTFSYMNRHLPVCQERHKRWAEEIGDKKCGYFELAIYPKYNRDYWLYVEIKETATLRDVDQFLRDIWLECCGHLSAFYIEGVSYDVEPQDDSFWGQPTKSMNCKLKSVLEKGMTFDYEYDFGSTTSLMITVVNYRTRVDRKEKLVILSRNNPIEILCDECGKKPAVCMCPEYFYEGHGWLCEDCAKTQGYEDEIILPVCNSPRRGVCGYCGSDIYPDQFVSDVETAGMTKNVYEQGEKMKPVILCYEKCTTCKKALKWIQEMGYDVQVRSIKEENPTEEELKQWHKKSGLPLKKFFNTSGNLYKEMKLKDKLSDMSEEEQYRLLSTDGMLVKRPLLVTERGVLPGFRQDEWKKILG